MPRPLEISDEIIAFDAASLERLPVNRASVVARFREAGDGAAVRVVQSLPADGDGNLLPGAVDALLIRVHTEMQRISEEFEHGARVAATVRRVALALRNTGIAPPYRVVDVGCGTGYVIRYLASLGNFGNDVTLTGVDFNPALIAEAQRLATVEQLPCRFMVANAFHLPEPATIYLSSGVLHHFPPEAMPAFFARHHAPQTQALIHYDFQPSPYAVPGAWLFHILRMREPLSRHDGVLSARRVHSGNDLTRWARQALPGFRCGILSPFLWHTPVRRVFCALVGVREAVAPAFVQALGKHAGEWHP